MRLDELPTSDRIEDRRGVGTSRAGLGIGTVVVLGLIGWALGIDPRLLIGGAEMISRNEPTQQQGEAKTGAPSDEVGHFVSAILGSTEAEWKEIFDQAGRTYTPPTLVMFTGATQSGCGFAQSAMARSTVRSTRRCISTPASSETCSSVSAVVMPEAKPASFRKPM